MIETNLIKYHSKINAMTEPLNYPIFLRYGAADPRTVYVRINSSDEFVKLIANYRSMKNYLYYMESCNTGERPIQQMLGDAEYVNITQLEWDEKVREYLAQQDKFKGSKAG